MNIDFIYFRDTLIVVILDGFTSFFAGFVIFSILGHLAETLERPVSDVAKAGINILKYYGSENN